VSSDSPAGVTDPNGRLPAGSDASAPRSAARLAKLKALVEATWAHRAAVTSHALAGGAALTEDGTGRAWVLIDDGRPKGFGAALAWALRRGATDLDVLVEMAGHPNAAGIIARRSRLWRKPPGVWAVRGRHVERAEPEPLAPAAVAPEGALAFVGILAGHGVDPVVEHGIVSGEILGLEVVRIVPVPAGWPVDPDDQDAWRIDVGVGHHDREARAELRAGQDPLDALDEVVADVKARRTPYGVAHPANRLARERWLRAVVMARPDLVGATRLAPLPAALARSDLRVAVPAPAGGVDTSGRPVIVVASVGVDVDLVPTAAEIRQRDDPSARLVLVVPAGDDYGLTYELASALASPAEVVTVPGDWPALGPGGPSTSTLVNHVGTPERT
jgi:hypothetical protein